jgi:hypothetical protein
MRHYYRVDIHMTARPLDDADARWQTFDDKSHTFDTLDEVRAFLTDQYAGQPTDPIYTGIANGHRLVIGVCYYFENADYSHSPVESWAQCDWVSVVNVAETTVAPSTLGVMFDGVKSQVVLDEEASQ